MMSQIADNVRKEIVRLVPLSLVDEISCFVFYDHHPKDEHNFDITICTKRGEVKEFHQRELVQSVSLETSLTPTEIGIFRNSKSELFYYIAMEGELVILSRKEKLQIIQRVTNVESFDVNDSGCGGMASLRIIIKDDAVPLVFDDDFMKLTDRFTWRDIESDDSLPLLVDLSRKLSEARYSYEINRNAYKSLINLRHKTAYTTYKQTNQHTDDTVFKSDDEPAPLKVVSPEPWVKKCNEKIVIILEVRNTSQESIDDVQVLLHGTRPSMTYVTKLYERIPKSPFWRKKNSQKIEHNIETAIAVTIGPNELRSDVLSKIQFSMVIFYKKQKKEYLKTIEDVVISALDAMSLQFDALSMLLDMPEEYRIYLAVIATSEKTELCIRHIKSIDDPAIDLPQLLSQNLLMDQIPNTNVVIKTMLHSCLTGVMVVFEEDEAERIRKDYWMVSLHSRCPGQIIPFIHCIHDAIPHRIVVTTRSQKLSPRIEELLHYDEDMCSYKLKINYANYGSSLLNQTSKLLEYLDNCMIQMNASKNAAVQSKIGSEIDLLIGGVPAFRELRNKLIEEAWRGLKSLKTEAAVSDSRSEGIEID